MFTKLLKSTKGNLQVPKYENFVYILQGLAEQMATEVSVPGIN